MDPCWKARGWCGSSSSPPGLPPPISSSYDGCGLSVQDLVTPRAFTTLLSYAARQSWGEAFRTSLPVGGVDGSLSGRFKQAALDGKVFAKTGTLGEARALSGYLVAAAARRSLSRSCAPITVRPCLQTARRWTRSWRRSQMQIEGVALRKASSSGLAGGVWMPSSDALQAAERAHPARGRGPPGLCEPMLQLPLCRHGEGHERSRARGSVSQAVSA